MSDETNAFHLYNLLRRDRMDPRRTIRAFDHFTSMSIDDTTLDPTDWEIVQDAGATAQIGPMAGKAGGWFQVACDGDDNDECYAASRAEAWIFNTTQPAMFETRIEHTAGSTDGKSSFVLGLSDTVAANTIADAGTLVASFDGALFFKGEDDAGIQFVTSNAATPVTTASATAWTDADVVRLGFVYDPGDGTTGKITPIVNGAAGDSHDIVISGLAEMHVLFGTKTHEDAVEQVLEIDWYEVIQRVA